ncbi:MAG TPA: SIS domain-containing protein [Franconibacter pulveris]|nr:SIS domain-containing protein [Franconibacter pulveris]
MTQNTTALLPLRPLEADFIPTLEKVLAQKNAIAGIAEAVASRPLKDIYFVGCGGSFSSSVHAHALLCRHSKTLQAWNLNAAEFMALPPARLGASSLVILSSHSGATPETAQAADFAKSYGAYVVSLSQELNTPLANTADTALVYHSPRTVTPGKQLLLLQLVIELLERVDNLDVSAWRDALPALPAALQQYLDKQEAVGDAIAKSIAQGGDIYVTAAGANYGAAYTLSYCYLMEMQWRNATPVLAGDFCHGPFEMILPGAHLVVFHADDDSRAMTQRAIDFARRYTENVHVFDAAGFTLPGAAPEVKARFAAIALGLMGTRLADHLEHHTGHSLDDRRYMYKVEY